jgi:hypothetical protein
VAPIRITGTQPIACTLAPGEFKDRLASIGALARDALRAHERQDLVLDLRYAPQARERVREMVRNEQACCSFLNFDLREAPDEIRVTITAQRPHKPRAHAQGDQQRRRPRRSASSARKLRASPQ